MIYRIYRRKKGEEPKIVFKTSDSHKVSEFILDAFRIYEEQGKKINGDLIVWVKGKSPDKYLVVKNGIENARESFRFVKDHF
jgi:lantibiotic modifying enzyme